MKLEPCKTAMADFLLKYDSDIVAATFTHAELELLIQQADILLAPPRVKFDREASTPQTRAICVLRAWSRRPGMLLDERSSEYLKYVADEFEQAHRLMIQRYDEMPWRPIAELDETTRHGDEAGFLLLAPELVDLDCNVHGVGMGYFQDDGLCNFMTQEQCDARDRDKDHSCWIAGKWSMQNDEWHEVVVRPTHYLRLRGIE